MWRSVLINVFLSLFMTGFLSSTVLAAVSVKASVNQTRVYENQTVEYTISISGEVDNYPSIALDNLDEWDVISSGTTRNFTWVNGRASQSMDFSFRLSPHRTGNVPIPSQTISVDGKKYVTKGIQIEVVKSSQTQSRTTPPPQRQRTTNPVRGLSDDDLFVQATVDKDSVYVNEQITYTFKFFRAVQPLQTPDYSEPSWTGFWKEDLPPQRTYTQSVDGKVYHVNEIKKALFPTAPGTHTIGPATISALVSERRREDPFSVFNNFNSIFGRSKTVTMRTDPIDIVAIPLPQDNQPASFSGAVGRFNISSQVDKTNVEVNEPITLSLKINGVGNIKSIIPPSLPDLPDFRYYQSSDNEKTERVNYELGGSRTVEHVLIPKRAGNYTLPSVEFSYFDPDREGYITLSTEPISVSVSPASDRFSSQLQTLQSTQLDLTTKDIRYLKSDIGELQGRQSEPLATKPLAFLLYLLPVVGYFVVLQHQRRREKLASDQGLRRLKRARKLAEKRLSEAKQYLEADNVERFYSETHRSLIEYFADRFNLSVHGLTEDKIKQFAEGRADKELIDRMVELLNKCDFGRFAPGGGDKSAMTTLWGDSRELIVEMEKRR